MSGIIGGSYNSSTWDLDSHGVGAEPTLPAIGLVAPKIGGKEQILPPKIKQLKGRR